MTTTEYLRSGPTDLEAVVETLCIAFDTDPLLTWNFPRDMANRAVHVAGFFRVTVQMILDHGGTVATTPNHEALGVWSPPGEPALGETDELRFAEALLAACGEGGERAVAIMAALAAAHPSDLPPHYHVMFAAVRPEFQFRGHSGAIGHHLALTANAEGAGVYAEASNLHTLEVWRRLGLRRRGAEIILPDGGPTLYPIWGDPGTWSLAGTRPTARRPPPSGRECAARECSRAARW
ncbi:GNAT family N-acetyltransferase [Frankia sp. R82]|uniref:GNAT family N-acetyltransferase n=1 Tax=Frankia sp. R82 TaxID=2950553 RepID=UPI002044B066|nr:GNAT family N-acetyltransferase [Frankia sp. R82]MCM3883260.1 GNAT family N-acetyltransferase [Frankia sp. R82]